MTCHVCGGTGRYYEGGYGARPCDNPDCRIVQAMYRGPYQPPVSLEFESVELQCLLGTPPERDEGTR